MNIAAIKIGRIAVKIASNVVDFMILTIILLMIAVSVYAMWDSDQVYQAADASQFAVYKPSAEEDSVSFAELQAINPEVFGWLTVYGTNIDHPIAQGPDNAKYVNTSVFGTYSLSGAIFLDYLNNMDFQDFNSILYGHHMEKQAMFGDLGSFSDKNFFDSRIYGNLYFSGKDYGLEFFAFIKTDAYDGGVFTPCIQGKEAQQAYLQNLMDKALYTRNIGVTAEDHILLLTTCSSDSTNGRDILAARITNEYYSDTFNTENIRETNGQVLVDRQAGIWESAPMWLRITLLIVMFILFVIAIFYIIKRKRVKE